MLCWNNTFASLSQLLKGLLKCSRSSIKLWTNWLCAKCKLSIWKQGSKMQQIPPNTGFYILLNFIRMLWSFQEKLERKCVRCFFKLQLPSLCESGGHSYLSGWAAEGKHGVCNGLRLLLAAENGTSVLGPVGEGWEGSFLLLCQSSSETNGNSS